MVLIGVMKYAVANHKDEYLWADLVSSIRSLPPGWHLSTGDYKGPSKGSDAMPKSSNLAIAC